MNEINAVRSKNACHMFLFLYNYYARGQSTNLLPNWNALGMFSQWPRNQWEQIVWTWIYYTTLLNNLKTFRQQLVKEFSPKIDVQIHEHFIYRPDWTATFENFERLFLNFGIVQSNSMFMSATDRNLVKCCCFESWSVSLSSFAVS